MKFGHTSKVMLVLAAGFSAATSLSARAADVDLPVADWSGWHMGIGGGFGMADHTLEAEVDANTLAGSTAADLTFTGIGGQGGLVAIEGGYDFELAKGWLLGAQADFTLSGIETKLGVDSGPFGIDYTLKNSSSFSVLGRVGHVVNDAALLYLVAGWTRSRFEGATDGLASTGLFPEDLDHSYSSGGFTIGSGIENVIADNITLKLEHRLTFNENEDLLAFDGPVGGADISASLDDLTKVQTIRAVLSYRPGVKAKGLDGSEQQWNGFHIGAGLGYGMINHELDADLGIATANFSGVGAEGVLGSVELGFDHLFGERLVAGILAGYTYSNVSTDLDLNASGLLSPTDSVGLDYSLKPTHNMDLLARLGVLSGPDVLWYGLAGYTRTWFQGDLSLEASGIPMIGGSLSDSYDYAANGLTLGAGVEVMLCENVSWRTEYRFTNYVSEDIIDGMLEASSNAQSVRTVVSWHF